jgi:hypothetical protein
MYVVQRITFGETGNTYLTYLKYVRLVVGLYIRVNIVAVALKFMNVAVEVMIAVSKIQTTPEKKTAIFSRQIFSPPIFFPPIFFGETEFGQFSSHLEKR